VTGCETADWRPSAHTADKVKDWPRHLRWMGSLPVAHREGQYLFVHAGIVPGRPLHEQRNVDLVWIRDAFLRDNRDHGHRHEIAAQR
jgi:hypothetical protein